VRLHIGTGGSDYEALSRDGRQAELSAVRRGRSSTALFINRFDLTPVVLRHSKNSETALHSTFAQCAPGLLNTCAGAMRAMSSALDRNGQFSNLSIRD
jgi:hypothetical protein